MTLGATVRWAGVVLLALVACDGGADSATQQTPSIAATGTTPTQAISADTECLISLRIEGFMKQAGIT